jgi:type I restriction enzyme S subunit
MEKQIPKLRFPEFRGEWEMKKIGDISEKVNSGKTPLGGEAVYVDEGILFIRSQNVLDSKLSFENSTYITDSINNTMKNSVVISNDILLNITGASLGRSCVVPINFTTGNVNQHVCIIRLNKENEPAFVQPIFASEKGQNIFTSLQTGSGREGLNFQSIRGMTLNFPTLPEQTKIAHFLTAVDEKLTALKQKKTLLEHYKKGVMQQIFSQEVRFKDENDNDFEDWEEKKLGEVSEKKSSNISANKIEENFGEYIIYGASGILKKVDFYKEQNDYISIIKDGAGVGRLFYCKGKSSVLGTMEIIRPKLGLNTYFLYCLLSNIDFVKYVTGSTIPHIYFKDYSNEICGLPCLAEQTKIANFLSAIDEKIGLCSVQIEKMGAWKKGLLQGMFV